MACLDVYRLFASPFGAPEAEHEQSRRQQVRARAQTPREKLGAGKASVLIVVVVVVGNSGKDECPKRGNRNKGGDRG